MIMLPQISGIVPVYNVQQFLDKCICSILQQTLVYFELILVDDGSTDTSGSICDDYALRDSRIVVLHQKNGGPSEARNVALSISQGQYVIFIDGHDWVEHDMLEYLYKMIVNSNSDVAQCGYAKVYNDSVNDCPLNSKINTITIRGTEKILTPFFKGDSVSSVIWDKI